VRLELPEKDLKALEFQTDSSGGGVHVVALVDDLPVDLDCDSIARADAFHASALAHRCFELNTSSAKLIADEMLC
jgi:hypothetical protein